MRSSSGTRSTRHQVAAFSNGSQSSSLNVTSTAVLHPGASSSILNVLTKVAHHKLFQLQTTESHHAIRSERLVPVPPKARRFRIKKSIFRDLGRRAHFLYETHLASDNRVQRCRCHYGRRTWCTIRMLSVSTSSSASAPAASPKCIRQPGVGGLG